MFKIFIIFVITILFPSTLGWTKGVGTDKEYHYSSTARKFRDAVSFCHSIGGRLPQVMNSNENEIVRGYVPSKGAVWLNAKKSGRSKYVWLDNSQIVYSNWRQTSGPDGTHDGIQLNIRGEWINYNYDDEEVVLCERIASFPAYQLSNKLFTLEQKFEELLRQNRENLRIIARRFERIERALAD